MSLRERRSVLVPHPFLGRSIIILDILVTEDLAQDKPPAGGELTRITVDDDFPGRVGSDHRGCDSFQNLFPLVDRTATARIFTGCGIFFKKLGCRQIDGSGDAARLAMKGSFESLYGNRSRTSTTRLPLRPCYRHALRPHVC